MNHNTAQSQDQITRRGFWSACLLATACLSATVGCDSGQSTSSVSGKITYQGEPVTSGLINFLPERGQPLGGGLRSDGTYQFKLPAGQYKVRIDTPPAMPADWSEKDGDPLPKLPPRQLPAKYGKYPTSGLTVTVNEQSSSQVVDFILPQK